MQSARFSYQLLSIRSPLDRYAQNLELHEAQIYLHNPEPPAHTTAMQINLNMFK